MEHTEFDYIVIGAGSAGSVIASRLTENPKISVCLIEVGTGGNSVVTRMPLGNIFQVPEIPGFNNWRFKTTPQQQLNNRLGYHPRGKGLGGTSMINGMIYMRGVPSDYDDWAKSNCPGWGWYDVVPFFKKAECNHHIRNDFHGTDGPLHVGNRLTPDGADQIFFKAAQNNGLPFNDDFNGHENFGCGHFQFAKFQDGPQKGQRCSAAAAYLYPNLHRPNLHVVTGVSVNRIIVESGRAISVECLKGSSVSNISARVEIVLSAGAFGSPTILMRSGIGPGSHLAAYGIETIIDNPMVGSNLQDHLQCALHFKSRDRRLMGLNPSGAIDLIKAAWRWRKTGQGLATTSFTESGAFLKSDLNLENPDLQIHFFSGIVQDHGRKLHLARGYSGHIALLHPESVGTVRLQSAKLQDAPIIDPNFLDDEADRKRMIIATKKLGEILHDKAFAELKPSALHGLDFDNDNSVLNYIRENADTAYHPVGTCKMGIEGNAVVDPELRVYGVENLRVADASVMPKIVSGNTNAPTIMIGERAADFIARKK